MEQGTYHYACVGDVCVLRPIGSITWQMSADLDNFLAKTLEDASVRGFFIDLSQATYIDSTNLGLLARIHVASHTRNLARAQLHSTHPAVTVILDDIGFTQIFEMTDANPYESATMRPIPRLRLGADSRRILLDAHRNLVDLGGPNLAAFGQVVSELEREIERSAGAS